MIKKVIIHNYKSFIDFDLNLNNDLSVIVGDNEPGKSSILEAINLALTRRIDGRLAESELSPHLFNNVISKKYIEDLQKGLNPSLPNIFIELYLNDAADLSNFRGTNNSLSQDEVGIRIEISFNDDYKEEFEKLLEEKLKIKLIPIEYYKISWQSFAGYGITSRSIPINLSFIDATTIRLQSGTDYYLQNIINDGLDVKERVALAVAYRGLKEEFAKKDSISAINKKLDNSKGAITDKQLAIAIDVSQKTNWEANLVPHLDELPFNFSGKGEQNSLKIMLALERKAEEANIVLVEEPENHLSFSSMNILIRKIQDKCAGKQIILTTHSSFVLNKLGLNKLILISNGEKTCIDNLPPDTQKYFKILSGYDTLRLILAKKAILVEGPSDELVVQKAYFSKNKKLPIEDGVDIINVRGLSFKRFLDIAKDLNIDISVITDNDGDYEKNVEQKYKDYVSATNIKIFYDKDNSAKTLEPQIVKCNDLSTMNKVLGNVFGDKAALESYMIENKTECALKLFEAEESIVIPKYVQDAVQA